MGRSKVPSWRNALARAPVERAVAAGLFAATLAARCVLLAFAHANPDTKAFLGTIAGGNRGLYDPGTLFNYAPGWAQALFGIHAAARALGVPFPVALGLVYLAVDLLTAWSLLRSRGLRASLLFFANPVSILASTVYLQFDNVAILFLVIALTASGTAGRARRGVVAALLSISLLIKHVAWFHPLLFLKRRSGEGLVASASPLAAYAVFGLSFVPFWRSWPGIRDHVFDYHSVSLDYGLGMFPLSFGARRAVCVLLVLAAVLILRKVELPRAAAMLFLALLLTMPGVWDYYFLWPIAAGALCGGGIGYAIYSAVVALFMLGSPDGFDLQTSFPHLPDLSGPWWAALFWLAWELRRLRIPAAVAVPSPSLPKAA